MKSKILLMLIGGLILLTTQLSAQQLSPLYRMYNPNGAERFYTTSTVEKDNTVASGFNDEGIACYAFSEQVEGTVPMYRLYFSETNHNLYTSSEDERAKAKNEWNFEDKGIAFYVYPEQKEGLKPLYRLYDHGHHLYTTSEEERNNLLAHNWVDQGISAFVATDPNWSPRKPDTPTITCNGVNYLFEDGNIYKMDNNHGKERIGYNVQSMKCYDDNLLLAFMGDGNVLKYDGRPNFWSSPCDTQAGTYYQASKQTMVQENRVYTANVLISSDNNQYFALLTKDGNLTMNKVTKAFDCNGTSYFVDYEETWRAPLEQWGPTGEGGYVVLQEDGHLCMYSKEDSYRWCAPFSKGSLKVEINESTGCLIAFGASSALWSSCEN